VDNLLTFNNTQKLLAGTLALVFAAGMTIPAFAETILYGVDRDSDLLRVIDPTDASTISSVSITLAGATVNGGLGAAIDPTTGTLWGVLKTNLGRVLVTINPADGVATSIGVLGDSYAGLEFKADGTLLGLIGDGGTDPDRLNILSKTDASVVSTICDLVNTGEDGETIVNANGVFIHFSAHTPGALPDPSYIIEIIDLDNSCAATDIAETGEYAEELIAAAYCPETDTIFLGEEHTSPSSLLTMSLAGVGTNLGSVDDYVLAGLACTGDEVAIGGELIPIDQTALLLAGLTSMTVWMIPTVLGLAGAGVYLVKFRKQ